MMGKLRIGISGWRYPPWRGRFYPEDLVQKDELHYASRQLDTIEINGTFYALQRPQSYARWYNDTPRNFVFAVKAPRFITHVRRLREIDGPMANFFASGVLELRQKLGPILWQFPPSFRFDPELFEAFLSSLPRDNESAARMAARHDRHITHVSKQPIDRKRRLRHAIEIRHESFVDPAFVNLLRKYGAGLVVADAASKWPKLQDVTAGFVYLRLHGDKKLYASGYTDDALDDWARRIRSWMRGAQPRGGRRATRSLPASRKSRDVYCYFDNDAKVKAPFDARKLRDKLSSASSRGRAAR